MSEDEISTQGEESVCRRVEGGNHIIKVSKRLIQSRTNHTIKVSKTLIHSQRRQVDYLDKAVISGKARLHVRVDAVGLFFCVYV